ncbi:MAG: hypothetical protein ACI915_004664 [Gammaproteobacteria bacterium]|jgi:uncharacterized protein (DUF1330 family)
MLENHVMNLQDHELDIIRSVAESASDIPLLMLNQNLYSDEADFPNGQAYVAYMAILHSTVEKVGGKVLWRTRVEGQAIGCDHDKIHEVLAIWYPSHQSFLELAKADGAAEMLARRKNCVANAVIHRCKGDAYPFRP